MRLLLVEDDSSLAEGILTSLKGEGYTLDWLQDGASALHALSSEPFDLAILDLGLPRIPANVCLFGGGYRMMFGPES